MNEGRMKKAGLAIVLLLVFLATTAEDCNGNAEPGDVSQTIHLADGSSVLCSHVDRSPDNEGWICTTYTGYNDAGNVISSDVAYYPDEGITASPSGGF